MFQVGLESNSCHTTEKLLELASSTGYQFIKANLLHLNTDLYKETPALPLTLVNIKTIHQRDVMATINCCDLDSIDGNQSRKSQLLFTKQIEWAQHLGLNQVVFEIPTGQLTNFSRTLMHSINVISFSRLWLKVGICDWNQFNTTRMACGSHKRLNVLLDFNETESNCMIDFEQWVAEPVQGISLAISRFIKNEKGYPVLSKLHQEWIIKLLTVADTQVPFKIIVNLAGEKVHFTGGLASIQQYLNHLFGRARGIIENTCIYKSFGQEFYHVLQVPLQPLYHNLASATYEVFEQDPVKYNLYEVAIFKAICDWNPSGGKESDLVW